MMRRDRPRRTVAGILAAAFRLRDDVGAPSPGGPLQTPRTVSNGLSPASTPMCDGLPGWNTAIFYNHLVNNLSAEDASPPPEVFVRAEEFFIDHLTLTTVALHDTLLCRPRLTYLAATHLNLQGQPVIKGNCCFPGGLS